MYHHQTSHVMLLLQVKEEGSSTIELDPQQMANLQRIRHQSLTSSYDQTDGPELNLAPPPMNV